jgi:hypothetical protein
MYEGHDTGRFNFFYVALLLKIIAKEETAEDETYWEYVINFGAYGVPYGTIVPKNSSHAWVVGRCFSATHDAHASCRSMAQTMSMGQAAGFAAVQSLQKDMDARSIDVQKLREELYEAGQILEMPNAVADISRNGWFNNLTKRSRPV